VPGSISGTVFNDANGNGTQDGSEAGITGVELYLDLKLDGTLDAGDPTTTTQTSGVYTFTMLAAGTYRVRQVLPSGQTLTTPSTGYYDVTIASNSQITIKNFGDEAATTFVPGTISGTVFSDTNANGTQDSGEAGLADATAYLDLNKDGTLDSGDPVASTNAAGTYTFTNLVAGTYRVREELPAGETLTSPAAGYYDVTITSNSVITGKNFGVKVNSISGTVFNDANGNGTLDTGETGAAGVQLYIDLQLDATFDPGDPTVTAGASGAYTFTNLAFGTYRIREIVPSGQTQTAPPLGYDDVTLATNSQVTGINFGNKAITGNSSIAGNVFDDANANGKFDLGEKGIAGVTVYLDANMDAILDGGETSTTTAADGSYKFTNLPAGVYRVREVVPAGDTQTSGTYTMIDYDVTLSAGANLTTKNFGDTVGTAPPTGSITGTVFNDANGDGSQGASEAGISGVELFLDLKDDGTLDSGDPTTVTTATGLYTFANLVAGSYRIREMLPGGDKLTVPLAGYYDVTVASGSQITGENFGDESNSVTSGTASIAGNVFDDANANGKYDSGEKGIPGVTVFLDANKNGILDAGEISTTTAADGSYLFTNLAAGAYRIREVVPTGDTQTSGTYTSIYYDVTLSAGAKVGTKNFGNVVGTTGGGGGSGGGTGTGTGSISGFAFNDLNGDGKFQSTETGIAGVTLYIDANDDGTFDTGETSVITAANGSFTFASLAAGTYIIRDIVPNGKKVTTYLAYSVTLPEGYNATAKNFGYITE
jgi:serine-aspartate repeat-containing protein C/D/E